MLIATHAMHATLPVPFVPVGWNLADNSSFGTTNINAVTTNNANQYVAVGSSGKLATSGDFDNWTQRDSAFAGSNIYCIAWGDGQYVIGGSSGKLATSPDGINWTIRTSSFGASVILAVTYSTSASLWIAAGGSGKLATSVDGISWTQRTSSFGTTFINGLWSSPTLTVAVGFDGKLATSTNGVNWTQRGSSFLSSVIYGVTSNPTGSRYVAVGDSGKIATSTNGTTWTQAFPATSFGGSAVRSVSANSEIYVAGGSAGKVGTSLDGNAWIQRVSQFGLDNINGVYVGPTVAIAVGNNGKIAYSIQEIKVISYVIVEEGPMVQILDGENIIDESGPWESLVAAVNWADAYVTAKNNGLVEPYIE